MMKQLKDIIFLYGYTEQDDYEMPAKGYRDDVVAKFTDDTEFRLCFYDSIRLIQDLEDEKIIFCKGLVIVEEVNKESIKNAINKMLLQGYFE